MNIRQRLVFTVLGQTGHHFGLPAPRQLFERADIEVAIQKIFFELGHIAHQKAPVLMHRVAADRRQARRHVLRHKRQHLRFHLRVSQGRGFHTVDQAAFAVRALVPVVHAVEHAGRLIHHQRGRFGDDLELRGGYHDGDLENPVDFRVEAAHFHVDPDEVVGVLCHNQSMYPAVKSMKFLPAYFVIVTG